MKKTLLIILFLSITACVFINEGCKREILELKEKQVFSLIKRINAAPSGFKIEADVSGIQTEIDQKSSKKVPRYFITLTNPIITFDGSVLKEFHFPPIEDILTFNCKKIIVLYGPKDKYLGLVSFSGLHFEMDYQKFFKSTLKKSNKQPTVAPPDIICKYDAQEITLDRLNISPVLDKNDSFFELITKIAILNPSSQSTSHEVQMEIIAKKEGTFPDLTNISLKTLLAAQEVNPDFISLYFSKSENSKEKIEALLKKPSALFDASFEAKGLSFSFFKDKGKEKVKVILENATFSEYLKPSNEKGFYKFGFACKLQNSSLLSPEFKTLETLGELKQLKGELSLDHLSPSFLQTYIELAKKAQSLNMYGSEESAKKMTPYGFQLISEFFLSKPTITFSLSPLEHRYGEIEVEAKFQFQQMGIPPIGKATATFYDLENLENRLRKENIFPTKKIKAVAKGIKKYFIQDADGTGKLTLEVRKEAPYLFLNNEPLRKKGGGSIF